MKVDLRDGDEKPNQYIIYYPETPQEEAFLDELRSFWTKHDR